MNLYVVFGAMLVTAVLVVVYSSWQSKRFFDLYQRGKAEVLSIMEATIQHQDGYITALHNRLAIMTPAPMPTRGSPVERIDDGLDRYYDAVTDTKMVEFGSLDELAETYE
jgi:hypothetical protein